MDLVEVHAEVAGRIAVAHVVAAVGGGSGRLHHVASNAEVVIEHLEPVRNVPGGCRRMRSRPVGKRNGRRERDRTGHHCEPDAGATTDSHLTHRPPLIRHLSVSDRACACCAVDSYTIVTLFTTRSLAIPAQGAVTPASTPIIEAGFSWRRRTARQAQASPKRCRTTSSF